MSKTTELASRVDALVVELGRVRAELARVRESEPPFEAGQRVFVKVGRHQAAPFDVDAVERAFGGWVVKGHFPHQPGHPYIYPAEMLEAD